MSDSEYECSCFFGTCGKCVREAAEENQFDLASRIVKLNCKVYELIEKSWAKMMSVYSLVNEKLNSAMVEYNAAFLRGERKNVEQIIIAVLDELVAFFFEHFGNHEIPAFYEKYPFSYEQDSEFNKIFTDLKKELNLGGLKKRNGIIGFFDKNKFNKNVLRPNFILDIVEKLARRQFPNFNNTLSTNFISTSVPENEMIIEESKEEEIIIEEKPKKEVFVYYDLIWKFLCELLKNRNIKIDDEKEENEQRIKILFFSLCITPQTIEGLELEYKHILQEYEIVCRDLKKEFPEAKEFIFLSEEEREKHAKLFLLMKNTNICYPKNVQPIGEEELSNIMEVIEKVLFFMKLEVGFSERYLKDIVSAE